MLAFAVTDGMLHFELAATYEIFTAPQLDYDVKICGSGPVRAGRFTMEPDLPLDQLERADTVIVPAIEDVDQPIDANLVRAVREAHRRGARIVSLCTG
ncbi:AraC family transcriptional regulator, partial [Lentzea aerocolonigenes]